MTTTPVSLKGKRVLVTGADGFIGSHLVESLVHEGTRVRAMHIHNAWNHLGWLSDIADDILSQVEIYDSDITDPNAAASAVQGIDIVFHLAALIAIPYSYRAPSAYVNTNILGTLNILQGALRSSVERIIHTSTSEVYGTAQTIPISESHRLNAQSPYAASKIGADQMALSMYRSTGVPVAVLRPFNTYGPRQSARAVIPTIIGQALQGKTSISLGNVSPTRDFLYVDDTVKGFLKIASAPNVLGEVIHIGSGREISISDLVSILSDLMGQRLNIISNPDKMRPQQSEVDRLCCDYTRARTILDWQPAVSLEDGLQHTIEWFKREYNRH